MARKKPNNKQLEELYEAFRQKLEEKAGISVYLLKVPIDRLNVSIGGKVKKAHILDIYREKYGINLDQLRQWGWSTGRVKGVPRCFYLIPPSKAQKRETQKQSAEPDLSL